MTRLYLYDMLRVSGLSLFSGTAAIVFRTAPPSSRAIDLWFGL